MTRTPLLAFSAEEKRANRELATLRREARALAASPPRSRLSGEDFDAGYRVMRAAARFSEALEALR